jgi:hypothetical protein
MKDYLPTSSCCLNAKVSKKFNATTLEESTLKGIA